MATAGDFTATELTAIKLKAQNMWADGQFAQEFEPNTVAAQAVLENQTARFQPFDDRTKDNQLIIDWIDSCSMVDRACVEECDISEDELATESQPVVPDLCRETGFSIDREKLRTNSMTREELAAHGQMRAVQLLDEYWDKQVILKMKAFAGVNSYPAPYTYAAGTTTIPAADYNRKLASYWMRIAKMHKIQSFYMVDNGSLFEDWYNAQIDAGNLDGKGDAARVNAMKMYFDMWGFAAAGITEDTFMIGRSAMAMKTINRYDSTPVEIGGKVNETTYTVPSRTLPGVAYDVVYQLTCEVTGGVKRYRDTWKFTTKGGIWLNPVACSGTNGILSFSKGA